MGDGVPNQGHFGHYQGGVLVGYILWYHDQQVTGNAWVKSPEMSLTGYADLHEEAANGQQAFETQLATTAWDTFVTTNAVDLTALRAGVLKLLP